MLYFYDLETQCMTICIGHSILALAANSYKLADETPRFVSALYIAISTIRKQKQIVQERWQRCKPTKNVLQSLLTK